MIDAIPDLTHLEGHLFWYLCMVAERTGNRNGKAGEICLTRSELARRFKIKRFSLNRAISGLVEAGLVTRGTSSDSTCLTMCHYMTHHVPHPDTSRATKSTQLELKTDTCEPLIRSEDVSEEEVKKGARRARKARAVKPAPPHPLNGLVSWDKEKREVRFEEGGGWRHIDQALMRVVIKEKLTRALTKAELQEGWGRLNGHLIGAPFKTNPRTLPAIVLNWFETDLRRKNNTPQRGKPLAQRIDETTKELMNGNESSDSEVSSLVRGLLESGSI